MGPGPLWPQALRTLDGILSGFSYSLGHRASEMLPGCVGEVRVMETDRSPGTGPEASMLADRGLQQEGQDQGERAGTAGAAVLVHTRTV